MKRLLPQIAVVFFSLLLVLTGCSSDFAPVPTQAYRDMSGRYHSSEPYRTLGTLTLQIALQEDSQRLQAWLAVRDDDSGMSVGYGSYGDGHVILDFDQGFESNFYFEGMAEFAGDEILAIDGNFVFADRRNPAPIRFDFVELVE